MDNITDFEDQLLDRDNDIFIPCKFPLCMICVSPITSQNSPDSHLDNEEIETEPNSSNEFTTTTISKETFLKGITILCTNLSLEDTFGKEEEWTKVLGTRGNFVGSVCCGRCSQLLRSLVELHELIVRTEVKLKEHVNQVESSVVNSLGLAAEAEYSISTCLRFREEVVKSFEHRRNPKVELSSPSKKNGLTKTRTQTRRRLTVNQGLESKLKEEALNSFPQIKLEKLPELEDDDEEVSAISILRDEIQLDLGDDEDNVSDHPEFREDYNSPFEVEDEEDEEFRPNHRYRGSGRKRGRPPKPKSKSQFVEGEVNAIRRPRGRPPKLKVLDETDPKPKRPRGRPRNQMKMEEVVTEELSVQGPEKVGEDPQSPLPAVAEPEGRKRGRLRSNSSRNAKRKSNEVVQDVIEGRSSPSPSPDHDPGDESEWEGGPADIPKRKRGRPQSSTKGGNGRITSPSKNNDQSFMDARVTRLDDPFNDRRTCRKVDKLLKDDSPYYLKPFLMVDPSLGVLSYYNCKILMERDRLVCKHPNCYYDFPFAYFSTFNAFRGMRFHVKMEHRKVKKAPEIEDSKSFYCCAYCDTQFERRFFMIQHIKTEHPNAQPFPSLCEVCGMSLPHDELLDHVITHKNEDEKELAKEMKSSSFRTRRPGKTKDPTLPMEFPCDKCDQVFENHTRLRIHARSHVPIELRKQFQCDKCPEKLGSLNGLKLHMNTVHFKEEQPTPFECHICGRKFIKQNREKYEVHMRFHTGELPFQCASCGKGFREKYRLKQHELLHLDMQIPCEFCFKLYKSPKYLRRHHYKHHPDRVQRPDKNLTSKYKNLEHLPEYHGPKQMYPCEPCGKVYIYKSQLVPHLKHAHKMFYPKSSDYPNMLTTEDIITVKHNRNRGCGPKLTPSQSPSSSPSQSQCAPLSSSAIASAAGLPEIPHHSNSSSFFGTPYFR